MLKRTAKKDIFLIVILFLVTRAALSFIGIYSRNTLSPKYEGWYEWNYSNNKFLDIWGSWDTGWYLDIAENGYSSTMVSSLPKKTCCGQNNFGFFPLYPLLIKYFNFLFHDFFLTGLFISNLFLILSGYMLYKLVGIVSDKFTARNAVFYLFAFPTSFILSGVYSESLFLFLAISSFYFAEREKWPLVGVSGFFLSLTKSSGVLILIPLIIKFLIDNRLYLRKMLSDAFPLLLIPTGLFTFMLFSLFNTGNPLYYAQIKSSAWQVALSDPFEITFKIFKEGKKYFYFIGLFIASGAALLPLIYKLLTAPYLIYSVMLFLLPLMSGVEAATSSPRHAVLIFPIYIALAKISKNSYFNLFLILILVIAQAYFMYYYSSGVLVR